MCENVVGSSPEGSEKVAMVKGGCFLLPKTQKAPKIKDFNVTLYIITPIGVDEIRSLSAVWNQGKALYGIITE